jgi:predicted hotdog family 3-hydroxylacyl-ACP dehydratase
MTFQKTDSVAELCDLLPHRPPMLLLDRLLAGDSTFARAEASVDADHRFFEEGKGVPAWALVELFAQTAALIGGLKSRAEGVPVPQGFLLGTRRLECPVSHVPAETKLVIEARTEFADGSGMGAYHCRILNEGLPVECVLTVFAPPTTRPQGESDHE